VLGRYISLISGMPAPAVLIVRGVLAWHENEAAERLFGTEGDRAGTLEAAKAVFADGEARVHPIAGRAFALAPLFDGVGEIEAVLLVESPLSCLPKVLNAFQEPMRHFSRIIHSLPHPVLAARPNGTIDFLSDSWYELVGEGRLMGDPAASFYRAVPPAERAMARARIASGAAGESPFSFRVPLITRTGQRWFDVTLRPIVRAGVAIKWVGAIADVDSEVRSRRSLARSQRHLRFVSEAAAVFARRSLGVRRSGASGATAGMRNPCARRCARDRMEGSRDRRGRQHACGRARRHRAPGERARNAGFPVRRRTRFARRTLGTNAGDRA
jgi:PAS domain-containing protein